MEGQHLRLRMLSKCLYAWDVDKRNGYISAGEISRIFVTNTGARAVELCIQWVSMLTRRYVVTAAPRLSRKQQQAFSREAFISLLQEDLAQNPTLSGPLGAKVAWSNHLEVTELDLPPNCQDNDTSLQLEQGHGARKKLSVVLHSLSPNRLANAEAALHTLICDTPHDSTLFSKVKILHVDVAEAKVPPSGLTQREARSVLHEVTKTLSTEQFEAFIKHIMETLDFVYDASHSNTRNRMLFESFKLWDNKDHGFVDAADFVRRMSTVKYAQDLGSNVVHKILESEGLVLPDGEGAEAVVELSLTDFKRIMNKIFSGCSEADADEILRSLKRQLTGDEDAKESRYTSCRHLRSEAERLLKRDERLQKISERKSSFSGSLRDTALSELNVLKISRLESSLRHCFDSVALDDITTLLDSSIAPPAARQIYNRVASATCILLDMSPVVVEGRSDFWGTLVDALRSNMVGFMYALNEFNRSSLSYVRICRCMAALEEHAYPSHVLTYSWFLSALSEWCRTMCHLVCINNKWEWPPVPIQSTATSGASEGVGRAFVARPPSAPNSARCKLRGRGKVADVAVREAIPESPFRASNLFARRRHTKADSYQQFMEKVSASERQQREAAEHDIPADTQSGTVSQPPSMANLKASLNDSEMVNYHEIHNLNESLGLPQPPVSAYSASERSTVCSSL